MCLKLIVSTQKEKYNLSFISSFMEFTVMCEVDDILRNLNALFATRDPFAAKKATETWQNYESVLRKEAVQKYT